MTETQEPKPMEVDGDDASSNDSAANSQSSEKEKAEVVENGKTQQNGDKTEFFKITDEDKDLTPEERAAKYGVNDLKSDKKRLIRESPCGNDCTNSCNSKFSEEQRLQMYDTYWSHGGGTEEQRKWIEKYCIEKALPKVTSKSIGSSRNRTFVYLYFLPHPDTNMTKVRVCKKYLAATLGISDKILSGFVYRYIGDMEKLQEVNDGSPGPAYDCTKRQMFLLREFIQSLPAQPVHYCRNEVCLRKLYELPDSMPDITTIYGMYSSHEESQGRDAVEEEIFRSVFTEDYNVGFHSGMRPEDCHTRESRKSKR